MKIAVAGGTGLIGTMVVAEARTRGHDVAVVARSTGVDLVAGTGVAEALAGTDVVIDVTNVSTLKADAATAFFSAVTRSLLEAEHAAGVTRHVALSIVGVDRAPHDYYAGKRAQELLVEKAPLDWTILRATQFHEFAPQMYAAAKAGPLHLAPRMRTQPIAAREVAARLVDLAEGPARGYVEIAGPREESLVDMVRRFARASGHRGWIPSIPLPGPLGRAQRDGTLLPGPDAERGSETFTAWLARTAPSAP
ncbi:SDR family oxidoreductase [Microbacterium sp. Marseille-Q6648]|uniref:SDR family oxidoreductase n=1 Tax=Microbacterium sp. Marseille-Q6648 TaxID=2937991 RepID=UPI00203C7863|nr:SDR family oxidoreductase [Microbacterium sp. Marseille-Q6648]